MSEPICPAQSTGLKQQETLSYSSSVPLAIVGIVHAIRDRSLSYDYVRPTRSLIPPVKKGLQDQENLSEKAQEISSSILTKSENQKTTLEQLISLGFNELAERLREKSGPPWDDILKFKNPLLIEQLYDLAVLLEKRDAPNNLYCMDLGLKIASNSEEAPSPTIGKLIFLIDYDPQSTCQLIGASQSHDWIHEEFAKTLNKTKDFLRRFKRRHTKATLQNPDVAYRNQLPNELTKYLISGTGHLNIGLVQTMLHTFVKGKAHPLNYEKHLIQSLQYLASNPSLREKLACIKGPRFPNAPAHVVIRTTLDLTPEHQITDIDAGRTALASLMTMLRQGKDGSCFATPLAISLLNHHLDRCLNDFGQLLEESKLTRNVEGTLVDFPFLLRIGDHNLTEKVRISRTGRLILPNGKLVPLSKVPGIIAVKKAMGIDKIKITKYLFSKPREEQPFTEITLKELLQALVKQAKTLPVNSNKRLADLYLHATFAFEAQECSPLLQTWENSIACMAEADGQSMVRSAILKSANQVLVRFLHKPLEEYPSLLQQAATLFKKNLHEKIHLQWDPHIPSTSIASDQQSTEGAFVLYDKGASEKPSRWVRLDSPQSYQAFILRTIDEVKKEFGPLLSSAEKQAVAPTLKNLEDYVESDAFLLDSLYDYYPPNGEQSNVLQNIEQLTYSPWITKSGNNLHKVMQIYLERPELKPIAHIVPRNGRDLLEKLVQFLKSSERGFQEFVKGAPFICTPVRIPFVHAFTFLPGHPSFMPTWSEGSDTADWLEKSVIGPGMEVSDSSLPLESRDLLLKDIQQSLIHRSHRNTYESLVQKLSASQSIRELRESLVDIIVKLESDDAFPPHTIASQVDLRIYQVLPETSKERLHKSAIHIADTNWADDINAVHFCLVVNPGTGDFELWSIKDDNSLLIPLDQTEWFDNKGWEFFKI